MDIIGGTRTTAKIICEAFPNLKCIVFDRPQVVENLSGSNNLTFVGGDMFKSIPKADSILLKVCSIFEQYGLMDLLSFCKVIYFKPLLTPHN